MEFVNPGDVIAGGARSNFGDQILRENLRKFVVQRLRAGNRQQVLQLRIPGLDAVFEIDGEYANFQGFDNILAEVLEALDLHGFLFEGVVQARILDGDSNVSGDGEKKLEVVAGKVIAVHSLAQSENGDGSFAETTGNKIIQIKLFERAANGFGFLGRGARGFKEQAAASKSGTRRVEE